MEIVKFLEYVANVATIRIPLLLLIILLIPFPRLPLLVIIILAIHYSYSPLSAPQCKCDTNQKRGQPDPKIPKATLRNRHCSAGHKSKRRRKGTLLAARPGSTKSDPKEQTLFRRT